MRILLSLILCFVFALSSPCLASHLGDVQSRGGLVEGSRLVTVTSLADDGEGSLREGLKSCGPCVVVFEVAGAINLRSDLIISKDHVTIAGETAPLAGIVLYGGTLKIRASDVVISHIGVFPGATDDPKVAENRDGLSIYGSPSKQTYLHGIILRNVSVGWGVDENIGIQGLTDGVRIERALIAQPLRHGGHPKGAHGMNLLLGGSVGRVVVVGSVLAGADYRSPRLTTGNRVSFLNNLVVASGLRATHLDTSQKVLDTGAIDIIGNAYIAGVPTKCGRPAITIDDAFLKAMPETKVYLADNRVVNNYAKKPDCLEPPPHGLEGLSRLPLTQVPSWPLLAAQDAMTQTLQFAGSHPLVRNPIDARVVQNVQAGTLSLIESERDIGGFPVVPEKRQHVAIPFSSDRLRTKQDVEIVRQWLCAKSKEVSGLDACPL